MPFFISFVRVCLWHSRKKKEFFFVKKIITIPVSTVFHSVLFSFSLFFPILSLSCPHIWMVVLPLAILRIENHDWHSFRWSCDRCYWKSYATILSFREHGEFNESNRNNWRTRTNQCERRHVQVSCPFSKSNFIRFILIINEEWVASYRWLLWLHARLFSSETICAVAIHPCECQSGIVSHK